MKILVLKIFDIQLNEWLTFEYTSFANQLKFTNMCKDMLPLRTDNFPPRMGIWTRLLKNVVLSYYMWYYDMLTRAPLNSMQSATNVIWEMCLWIASNMAKCS